MIRRRNERKKGRGCVCLCSKSQQLQLSWSGRKKKEIKAVKAADDALLTKVGQYHTVLLNEEGFKEFISSPHEEIQL